MRHVIDILDLSTEEINALIEAEDWDSVLHWAIDRHDTDDPELDLHE